MISLLDLKSVSKGRLLDAQVLQKAGRFDGSVYMCGYAVEVELKTRACRTLKWLGFPETKKEFEALQSFKTHNLEILLRLSGAEGKIRSKFLAEWSIVMDWNPESRYRKMGTATNQGAIDMIAAAKRLLGAL
jgi:hypothetical protein